jgi:hypothetical protein
MTVGKAGLLAAGLVGVVALGIATGPTIRDNWTKMKGSEAVATAPAVESSTPTPAKAERPARRAKASPAPRARDVVAIKKDPTAVHTIAVSVWEPELRDRVKAVLNPGSRPEIAAADFANAEQFMTVAHAARNTKVPFMVLKHRVLNQGQSLSEAIHEFKPTLDAKAEVTRARAAARADLEIRG